MWFFALVFIAIPVVLVGWWLKLLYSNRNVPNPPSFGKPLCCGDNDFLNDGFINDMNEHSHRITHGYYD